MPPLFSGAAERLPASPARRPGDLFHPAEGAQAGSWLGHGPVFRDLNVALDPRAAARGVGRDLPLSLLPHDAARGVEFGAGDVQALAESGGAGPWPARRLGAWLADWNRDIGRAGFYPFDLLAAASLLEPQRFGCAAVTLRVAPDRTLVTSLFRREALLAEPRPAPDGAEPPRTLCCGRGGAAVRPCNAA